MSSIIETPRCGEGVERAKPLVSVIMPVFNKAAVIGDSIASVLGQRFGDHELIIIDDCSTDDIATALLPFNDDRIVLVRHVRNLGASAARNSGIERARGHYCAFLDADDTWRQDKLEKHIAFTEENPGCRLSCTAYHIVTKYMPAGEVRYGGTMKLLNHDKRLGGCTTSPGSTLMAERVFLAEIGPWDETLRRLEDWDLLLRAAKRSPIYIYGESLSAINFVDCGINYELIAGSCRRIKERILADDLPFRSRMILNSTIHNELSVAAYRNRRYPLAAWHFLLTMAFCPRKETSYFKRIFRAVWFESTRVGNSSTTSN